MRHLSRRIRLILALSAFAGLTSANAAPQISGPTGGASKACDLRFKAVYNARFPNSFVIENLSASGWALRTLTIDLSSSFGDAVFNSTPGLISATSPNAFYKVKADDPVAGLTTPVALSENNRILKLSFEQFTPKRKVVFTIDLDDTSLISSRGQRRVTFGELAGAKISARMKGPSKYPAYLEATFNQTGLADSAADGCS